MKKINLMLLSCTLLFLGACGNSKEKESINKEENLTSKETHQDISGVDFFAEAEDDSWKLSITFDGQITFTDHKNDIEFVASNNVKNVAQGADVVNISAENDSHVLHVNIDIADCMRTGKKVNIMIRKADAKKGEDYSGCGYYRGTPQLHDIWALQEINGEAISPKQFPKELPHFEFNLVTQKMSGFAGCNQVNGDLRFEYNRMIIEPLVSTRMYCAETSKIENDILSVFRNQPFYHFNDLYLHIETPNGSVVLKKVD